MMNALEHTMGALYMLDQPKEDIAKKQIVLELLESVERDSTQTHRRLSAELGVALGLVNAYMRRCVSMGLLKVRKTPAHRYAYFLTPKGFAEKSRLTASYLTHSFSLFRRARLECSSLFQLASARGLKRILLVGKSDLAEIAALCALEHGVKVVGTIETTGKSPLKTIDQSEMSFDALMVTSFEQPQQRYEELVAQFDASRVLVPKLLGVDIDKLSNGRRAQMPSESGRGGRNS